jgi:hypothetical protein
MRKRFVSHLHSFVFHDFLILMDPPVYVELIRCGGVGSEGVSSVPSRIAGFGQVLSEIQD